MTEKYKYFEYSKTKNAFQIKIKQSMIYPVT